MSTIAIEPVEFVFRAYDGCADSQREYEASGVLCKIGRLGILKGLHGHVSKQNVLDMYADLKQIGIDTLYVQRLTGHVVPRGEYVNEGDFSGYFRVDLCGH